MKTSSELVNISKALVEAHKDINHATKDAKNPHFRNAYATLESVIDASKAALLKNGIVVIQSLGEKSLTTRLQHVSGEFIESDIDLLVDKNNMQGMGSAITYARRYSLAAMLNMSQADDDGNEAAKHPPNKEINATKSIDNAKKELNFNDYVIGFGKKMKGQKLNQFSVEEHASMLSWLDVQAIEKGQPLNGPAKEYSLMATEWIKKQSQQKLFDNNEAMPE